LKALKKVRRRQRLLQQQRRSRLIRRNNPEVKLIVGLGNPGSRYSHTRHNAGRLLVESIARECAAKWKVQKSLKASVASTHFDSEEVSLAFPETFMNVSGEAVSLLVKHFSIDVSRDLLIVIDEMALPFGKWRLRGHGSDGGHNGLKSVEAVLGTSEYPRLRMGIGPEEIALSSQGKPVFEEYVLQRFTREESEALPPVLKQGFQACRLWAMHPIADAMNVVNA
jgi:peptidyl-tRNA hydrolase, PTH1 family